MVAIQAHNLKVVGSSPTPATIPTLYKVACLMVNPIGQACVHWPLVV